MVVLFLLGGGLRFSLRGFVSTHPGPMQHAHIQFKWGNLQLTAESELRTNTNTPTPKTAFGRADLRVRLGIEGNYKY